MQEESLEVALKVLKGQWECQGWMEVDSMCLKAKWEWQAQWMPLLAEQEYAEVEMIPSKW